MIHQFTATVERSSDMDAAYVRVPIDIKKEYGKGRLKMKATFDGEPYSGSVVNMGVKNADGSFSFDAEVDIEDAFQFMDISFNRINLMYSSTQPLTRWKWCSFPNKEDGVPLVKVNLFALFLPFGGGKAVDILRGQREVAGYANHRIWLKHRA